MADSYLPLVKKIIAALKADGTLSAIVSARVYTEVPQEATFPYVIVHVTSLPFDSADTTGMEHTINVQGFSRLPTSREAAAIRAAVYAVLHRTESSLTLDTGQLFNINYTGLGFVTQELDGVTWQSLAQFRAVVMD